MIGSLIPVDGAAGQVSKSICIWHLRLLHFLSSLTPTFDPVSFLLPPTFLTCHLLQPTCPLPSSSILFLTIQLSTTNLPSALA